MCVRRKFWDFPSFLGKVFELNPTFISISIGKVMKMRMRIIIPFCFQNLQNIVLNFSAYHNTKYANSKTANNSTNTVRDIAKLPTYLMSVWKNTRLVSPCSNAPIILPTIWQLLFRFSSAEPFKTLPLNSKMIWNIVEKTIELRLSDDVCLFLSKQTMLLKSF